MVDKGTHQFSGCLLLCLGGLTSRQVGSQVFSTGGCTDLRDVDMEVGRGIVDCDMEV